MCLITHFFMCVKKRIIEMYYYLPEVFVHKGYLVGGEAFPVGLASGVSHQNRINLKARALKTTGGGCKDLQISHVTIQLLKDEYVSSKKRFCNLRSAVCVCVCILGGRNNSPLTTLPSPDPRSTN